METGDSHRANWVVYGNGIVTGQIERYIKLWNCVRVN